MEPESKYLTAAEYLGYRLKEHGVTHVFVVPGDYNLPLLDGLVAVPGLTVVNTANELNAGYAADGHARAVGLGCVVTTFLVGALSAINATAASYAEEVPVLSVVGCPNTSQFASSGALHHTLGNLEEMNQEVACYKPVTVYQTICRSLCDARYLIDKALTKALTHRKPVLLEVCRDVSLLPHASFGLRGAPLDPLPRAPQPCDAASLEAAAAALAAWLAPRRRPVIIAGRRARHFKAELLAFAEAAGFAVATVADSKGCFPEDHEFYLGTSFKAFTAPESIAATIRGADALLFVGFHFNEMSWAGPIDYDRSAILYKSRADIGASRAFTMVPTGRLLAALAGRVARNTGAIEHFRALPALPPALPPAGPEFSAPAGAPLTTEDLFDLAQSELLAPQSAVDVVVDTGDSLWRAPRLRLPRGAAYETQCLAGNIGAGLPTALGFSLGAAAAATAAGAPPRRTLLFQGDGGFQMTAQDAAAFARWGSNAIVILVNNDGYLIERYLSPIPRASYNFLPQWRYADVVEAMCRGVPDGKFKAFKVASRAEAAAALAEATSAALADHFVFIEAVVSPHDGAPCAGLMRQQFTGAFFAPFPFYAKRLAKELGPDFVKSAADAAAQRVVSFSVSAALAAAARSVAAAADGRAGSAALPAVESDPSLNGGGFEGSASGEE